MELRNSKKKKDSKGFLGGIIGAIGFGLLASQLTRITGVEVSKEEITDTVDHGKFVWEQKAVWVGLAATIVGLWGNWVRTAKIAFDGYGKNPLKSKGVMGNLTGFGIAAWALIEAVAADWDQVQSVIGDGQESWKVIAPAVMAVLGTAQGFWGRWRATSKVDETRIPANPNSVLFMIMLIPVFLVSCSSTQLPVGGSPAQDDLFPSDQPSLSDQGMRSDADLEETWYRDGAMAVAGAALIRSITITGGIENGMACAEASLAGFGPKICLGIATPDIPPQSPPPLVDPGAKLVVVAQDEFRDR